MLIIGSDNCRVSNHTIHIVNNRPYTCVKRCPIYFYTLDISQEQLLITISNAETTGLAIFDEMFTCFVDRSWISDPYVCI